VASAESSAGADARSIEDVEIDIHEPLTLSSLGISRRLDPHGIALHDAASASRKRTRRAGIIAIVRVATPSQSREVRSRGSAQLTTMSRFGCR
jgi:hypothetical protein